MTESQFREIIKKEIEYNLDSDKYKVKTNENLTLSENISNKYLTLICEYI